MNLKEIIRKVLKEEITDTEYAVIEIIKPSSRMPQKWYFQAVPLNRTQQDKIYIKRGPAGILTISTKNIKIRKIFKKSEKEEMDKYLEKLREEHKNKINENKEETEKDLSPIISKLLDRTIVNSNDNVCKIEVTAPWDRDTMSGGYYERYKIRVYFIGEVNHNSWFERQKEEKVMNEVWDIVYNYMNLSTDLYSKRVGKCFEGRNKGEQTEGEITERCWKGYTQKGMKTMFGKRYPNCVKKKK